MRTKTGTCGDPCRPDALNRGMLRLANHVPLIFEIEGQQAERQGFYDELGRATAAVEEFAAEKGRQHIAVTPVAESIGPTQLSRLLSGVR